MTESSYKYHETGINSSSHVSAKRVPTFRIEEVPKLSKIVIDQKLGCSVVEPRIELVDDGLITDDAEDSNQTGHGTDQEEDRDADSWLPFVEGGVV